MERVRRRKKTEKLIILIEVNREVAIRVFDFQFFRTVSFVNMSSAESIASSIDLELQAQDWEGLATQEDAPGGLDSGVGGVDIESQTDEVLFGETIIFIPTQAAAAKVCGARVGSNSGKRRRIQISRQAE